MGIGKGNGGAIERVKMERFGMEGFGMEGFWDGETVEMEEGIVGGWDRGVRDRELDDVLGLIPGDR